MNRRQVIGGFFGGILGWLGLKKVKAADSSVRGFIVFKINVTCIPPFRVDGFLDNLSTKWKKSRNRTGLKGWETIWQPFRENFGSPESSSTQIFLIDKDGSEIEVLPTVISLRQDLVDEFRGKYDDYKSHTREYVLLMLGAPVVQTELDKTQIDQVIQATFNDIERQAGTVGGISGLPVRGLTLLHKGSLARVKIVLGRIRSHFINVGPYDEHYRNGGWLITEGKQELDEFHEELKSL